MSARRDGKDYHRAAHLVYLCRYHVIFCPKYRRKMLKNGLDEFIKETFLKIAAQHQFSIIEMEIMPDHVHLLIDCNPRYGITNCVKALKRYSVPAIRKFDSSLNSKMPAIWTRSVFIASVGSVSLDVVKKYIENQKKEK